MRDPGNLDRGLVGGDRGDRLCRGVWLARLMPDVRRDRGGDGISGRLVIARGSLSRAETDLGAESLRYALAIMVAAPALASILLFIAQRRLRASAPENDAEPQVAAFDAIEPRG